MKKISVVVPVFCGEYLIKPFYNEMKKVEQELLSLDVQMELIFIDDGSTDNTLRELLKIKQDADNIKVIKLTRNFGAVSASNTGLKFVSGDCFTIYAVDLQDPPYLIVEMVKRWKKGSKYIICQRSKNRQDPFITELLSKIYYRLITLLVVKDFPKTGFDIALWDKSILSYLENTSKNINRSLFSHWLGYRPEIIFYDRPKRAQGKSGWTFSKKFKLFLDSFLGFSVLPVRVISIVGFVVAFLSMIYGAIIIVGKIFGNVKVEGFTTVATLISFLLGLVIVMLGIIGEYIVRIFDEVNKRPEAVIDEIY